ncbi:MAG: penicillin amidase [Solirubrobacteraceae bacterium]|jgi:penicillin amidase|nr:penicillin amidase [Solirubrobacteraceae bacterium]
MSLGRAVLRLMGRRLPVTSGTMSVAGLEGAVQVRRDGHGIPHVAAQGDHDAFFAVGFCHGQDRSFQLETLLRAARGTLSALVGEEALPVDRMSRRVGFARAAQAQLAGLGERERAVLEAYTAGVNAGRRGRPHELTLLRCDPTPWTPLDSLAALGLVSFGLAGNWDMELGRLRVLERDGPEALRAVDPSYPSWLAVTAPPGRPAGTAADRLAQDMAALSAVAGGGGSNNWALSGARTATGRPLVANDPHLSPTLPAFWYLIHVRTPDWQVAGASVVGAPGWAVGHNDSVAWGVTNSGADVVDLYLVDASSLAASEVVEERIEVKGGEPVVEQVSLTSRGPVVGLSDGDGGPAVAMRAAFLESVPLTAVLDAPRARTWGALRDCFEGWPGAPLNLVGGDDGGAIGWKVTGRVPRRDGVSGLLPQPWSGPDWDGFVAYSSLPGIEDPPEGFVATANNKPVPDGDGPQSGADGMDGEHVAPITDGSGPWIGADWMDGYRVQRISEELAARSDWDVDDALALQRDVRSLVWRDVRDSVLSAPREEPRARRAVDLLHGWDGEMAADSQPAALFALWLAEMSRRAAAAKAPRSVEWALGKGSSPFTPHTYVGLRQAGHLARLLRERPEGWFADGWDAEVAGALSVCLERLEREFPDGWAWGSVRTLTLRHPAGARKPFDRVFNLGPIPYAGDTNTVSQAATPPLDPRCDPLYLATLRIVMDVGDWDRTRVVLAGGQSGNPLSPHYSDLFEVWRRGSAVPFVFSEDAVVAATVSTLELRPA